MDSIQSLRIKRAKCFIILHLQQFGKSRNADEFEYLLARKTWPVPPTPAVTAAMTFNTPTQLGGAANNEQEL